MQNAEGVKQIVLDSTKADAERMSFINESTRRPDLAPEVKQTLLLHEMTVTLFQIKQTLGLLLITQAELLERIKACKG